VWHLGAARFLFSRLRCDVDRFSIFLLRCHAQHVNLPLILLTKR
jgi:hypothetical protein